MRMSNFKRKTRILALVLVLVEILSLLGNVAYGTQGAETAVATATSLAEAEPAATEDQTADGEQTLPAETADPAAEAPAEDAEAESAEAEGAEAESAQPEAEEPEDAVRTVSAEITAGGVHYTVDVAFDDAAALPEDVTLQLRELTPEPLTEAAIAAAEEAGRPYETERFVSAAERVSYRVGLTDVLAVDPSDMLLSTAYLDMALLGPDGPVEPAAPVEVTVTTDLVEQALSDTVELAMLTQREITDDEGETRLLTEGEALRPENLTRAPVIADGAETAGEEAPVTLRFTAESLSTLGLASLAGVADTRQVSGVDVTLYAPRGFDVERTDVPAMGVTPEHDVLLSFLTELTEKSDGADAEAPAVPAAERGFAPALWLTAEITGQTPKNWGEGGLVGYRDDAEGRVTLFDHAQTTAPVRICAGDVVTVLWDTGLRSATVRSGGVRVSGLLPADAVLEARNVTGAYADAAALIGDDEGYARTMAAYDLSITADGETYAPDETRPVTVTLSLDGVAPGKAITVWHVAGGAAAAVEDCVLADGSLTFTAAEPGVYVVVNSGRETTVTAGDGNTYEITVTYPYEAAIPREAELTARELTGREYAICYSRTQGKLGMNGFSAMRAFDIAFLLPDGTEAEPQAPVQVSIRMLNSAMDHTRVVHFGSSGTQVITPDMSDDGTTADFTADSFSVYAVAGESTPRRTYHFYIDSGDGYAEYLFRFSEGAGTTNRVTVRNGQKPDVPQPPAVNDEGKAFAGWYAKKEDESAEFEDAPYDFDTPVTDNEVVYLYAVYEDFWTVTFYDQYSDQTGDFPVAFIRRGIRDSENKARVKISDLTTTYNGGRDMAFYGWSATKITVPGSAEDDAGDPVKPLACNEDGCIEISDDTELYPIYKGVKWLSFWSGPTGSGATYFPARYYFGGVGPDKLEVPQRSGFTFLGWYAGTLDSETEEVTYGDQIADERGELQDSVIAGGMSVYDNKLHLKHDAVLYAQWEVTATAEYTVNIYKVTGEEEKLVNTYTETGPVGSAIPLDKYKHESIEGYLYDHYDYSAGVLKVFYAPYTPQVSSKLTFRDSATEDSESPLKEVDGVDADTALSAYAPAAETLVREDYNFTGWFRDRSCTIPVDLSALKMPDHDLTLYAGWEVKEYLVQIDPNYGALYAYNDSHVLEGTGATWFWEGPGGQPIQEYQHVTRDYVESNSGSWYYVNHSKAYYGDGPTGDRKTYYTQDPDEATEYTRFEYAPGVYRYAGWYEVHEDGSETLYDFSRVVDHDTTLRLHWKKMGDYYLKFVSGSGTLNESGDTEFLDKDVSYADNAQVVITRSAIAPEGYTFAGWRVEGDDSGRLYGLGESFTLHAGWAVSTSGRETVTLEAVYIKVGTASIVYDANGGTFDDSIFNNNYGSPGDNTVYGPGPELTWNEETHTVSGIVNNSDFILSSGAGLTRDGARLKGWSDKPVCDDSAGFYGLGATVGVDTEEPITLYAVWEVKVTYHLNKTDEPTAAWGDDLWDASYTYDSTADTYAKWVNVGTVTAEPAGIPVCTGEQMFFYWTADTTARTAYDFTQPVTGALDLYALWRGPIEVPVHAADASALTIEQRDNGQGGWEMHNVMAGTEEVSLPGTYVTKVPDGYTFAFVAAHDKNTGLQTITEDEAVTAIYYNQSAKHLYVKYASGADAQLGEDMELYFVYYWQHPLDIRYKKMLSSGEMVDATVSGAPADTAAALGSYDMASGVTAPLDWAADLDLTHYAFAVGSDGATNASALNLITRVSDSDSDRPALRLRNTWRGFQYSTDDGASWVSCGYDPTLYVVYYTQQPTVIMFRERTVGDSADMGTPFTFNLKVTEETRTTTTVIRQARDGDDWTDVETNVTVETTPATLLYDTGAAGNSPFLLKDGQANSAILFYSKQENGPAYTEDPAYQGQIDTYRVRTVVTVETAQTAELVQTTIDAFDTTVTENGAAYDAGGPRRYTFTASEDSEGVRDVTFTNTNRAKTVQVHVARIENGAVMLRDDLRDAYQYALPVDTSRKLTETLDPDTVYRDAEGVYAFGAVAYGTSHEGVVTLEGTDAVSVAYKPVEDNLYSVQILDSDGRTLSDLGKHDLYYLYYPMPRLRYVKKVDNDLTLVRGSTDGSTDSETVTYGGQSVRMNGQSVRQDQRIALSLNGLQISQDSGSANFKMPPLLDDGVYQRYLTYQDIAVGPVTADGLAQLQRDSDKAPAMQLRIMDNRLKWSFDGAVWNELDDSQAIFAIYAERGYDLKLSKVVNTSASGTNPIFTARQFVLTVTGDPALKPGAVYDIIGGESETVTVNESGQMVFPVVDGSTITVLDLPRGTYTVTETQNENYDLTAKSGPLVGSASTVVDVTDNSSVTLTLDTEKQLVLTNAPRAICQITEYGKQFYTLQDAVDYVVNNIPGATATIEMLSDYLMPAEDAVIIPSNANITLKTEADFEGGTRTAVIRRSTGLTDAPLITDHGQLTLESITLDGNDLEAHTPLVTSAGALTVGFNTRLQNNRNTPDDAVENSGKGGAVYATGSVTVSGKVICLQNNTARYGGVLYYAGTGVVNVESGAFSDNSAEDGGVLYATGGTITVSGGTMTNNSASVNGGVVYSQNGAVTVSGGTFSGNSASVSGGVVYSQSGAVTVSGGAIESNTATTGNGGGISTGSGNVTVSGGAIESNTATTGNGGGISTDSGNVTVSGGSMSGNSAANGNGGAVYSQSGAVSVSGSTAALSGNSAKNGGAVSTVSGSVTVSGGAIESNTATTGNGGGISTDSGNVTVSGGSMSENTASSGNGGAVYLGSGTLEMSGGTMGDDSDDAKANEAVNGAAVFIQTGRGTFSGGTIAHNTATDGGAVGMGGPVAPATETTVRMDFSGTIRIQENTCGTETRNVYLDQDTDAVINTGGFGNGAYVGIYAPDGESFTNRGDMGDKFGVCSGGAPTLPAFHNDRQANLKAAVDDITKRIYWSSPINVKVRYLASYTAGLPNGTTGSDSNKYSSNSYYPAFDDAAISVLADALRGKNKELSSTAVYGTAILNAKVNNTEYWTYDKYLTRLKWEDGKWKVQVRDGSLVPLGNNQLVVYYTEPAYLSIENNTEMDMDITSLKVTLLGDQKSVLNSSTVPGVTGFGLVFSRNGTIQEELLPVEMTDGVYYRLEKNGGSVNILIPGCRDCQFTMTRSFVGGTGTVKQRINGTETHPNPNVSSVTVTGKLKKDSTNFEIIYGEDKPICKIVCEEPTGISAGDYLRRSGAAVDGKYEYTFAKMGDAVAFAVKYKLTDVDIQMLVDYLMPSTDRAVIRTDSADHYFKTISLTTARSGQFQYPGTDDDRRAIISRGVGNADPLIDVTGNVGTSGTAAEETCLRVHDINFDGKNLAGACEGGALSTVNCRVEITDAKLVNCVSLNGGALFISYGTASIVKGTKKYSFADGYKADNATATLTRVEISNCKATYYYGRSGGGAIWTNAKTLTAKRCEFTSCISDGSNMQGGAVFHRIESRNANNLGVTPYFDQSRTDLTDCTFTGCKAEAGGAMESDATDIQLTRCIFTNCNSTLKDGGAVNVYIYEENYNFTSIPSRVYLEGCTFNSCTAHRNGGAVRSLAVDTEAVGCIFTNTIAKNDNKGNGGGAMYMSNQDSKTTKISDCMFTGTVTNNGKGGAVYTLSKELTVTGSVMTNCQAKDDVGGAIYHNPNYRNNQKGSFTSLTNCNITGCIAKNGGGALYSNALNERKSGSEDIESVAANVGESVKLLSGCTIKNCTAQNENGGGVYLSNNTKYVTIENTTIQDCTAKGSGGGLYSGASTALTVTDAQFDGCISGARGGGIYHVNQYSDVLISGTTINGCEAAESGGGFFTNYVNSASFTGCEVSNNKATGTSDSTAATKGCGGGILFDTSAPLTLTDTTVSGNSASNMGGGIYTKKLLTLVCSIIEENRLTTNTVDNAAGVYMTNDGILVVGEKGRDGKDNSAVADNTTARGEDSNLRLPVKNNGENQNRVTVNRPLGKINGKGGYIGVTNAYKVGTQFGSVAESTLSIYDGLAERDSVFQADTSTLYGIISRTDTTRTMIVWAGPPIAKITDGSGNLLYFKNNGTDPAIFDVLDDGSTARTSAFSQLRSSNKLYYAPTTENGNGDEYLGKTFCVKMLVEEYELTKTIQTPMSSDVTIILTTASKKDTDHYPFDVNAVGNRASINRSAAMTEGTMMYARSNAVLRNILLDGKDVPVKVDGAILRVAGGQDIQVSLETDTVLQNGYAVAGTIPLHGCGGAVSVTNDYSKEPLDVPEFVINGGLIRFCHAELYGGGVYAGSNAKRPFELRYGKIQQCRADRDGGGVYVNNTQFLMTGGTISGCRADRDGGGVFVADGKTMNMHGGYIGYEAANSAGNRGGGIAVGGADSRLNFKYQVNVSKNTCDRSEAENGICNVQLDQGSNTGGDDDTTNGIIHADGLFSRSYIGVYVPGDRDDKNPEKDNGYYLYHGGKADPFAGFTGNPSRLYCFVNDRNGLKGGLIAGCKPDTVYWIRIFSIRVSNTVEVSENVPQSVKDAAGNQAFTYTVCLWDRDENVSGIKVKDIAEDIQTYWDTEQGSKYGDIPFQKTIGDDSIITATITIRSGEDCTAMNLPDGLGYSVTQAWVDGYCHQPGDLSTDPINFRKGTTGDNKNATTGDPYTSDVAFTNILPVCKITDADGNLLYRNSVNGKVAIGQQTPAVYKELSEAFSATGLYGEGVNIDSYGPYRIEMLVGEYTLLTEQSVAANKDVTLTTASRSATDHFPYGGTKSQSIIKRGFNNGYMIKLDKNNSALTLTNIKLDGNLRPADSGLVYVDRGRTLSVTSGAWLTNSRSSNPGAGVYLKTGGHLELSRDVRFGGTDIISGALSDSSGNFVTTAWNEINGGAVCAKMHQDIYLEEDNGTDPADIVITGDLSGDRGSIWVWAVSDKHSKQLQAFAKLDNGVSGGNLAVFRNARSDTDTENGTDTFLFGCTEGEKKGYVYWSGVRGTQTVILRKVTVEKSGRYADLTGGLFTVHGSSGEVYVVKGKNGSGDQRLENLPAGVNGVFWVGQLPYGTYWIEEVQAPTGYSKAKPWFKLEVKEDGFILHDPVAGKS